MSFDAARSGAEVLQRLDEQNITDDDWKCALPLSIMVASRLLADRDLTKLTPLAEHSFLMLLDDQPLRLILQVARKIRRRRNQNNKDKDKSNDKR